MDPNQAIQAIRAELREEFNATIDQLRIEIQRQNETIQLLQNAHSSDSPNTHSKPKPSLPDPEKFTGQAFKLDTWLPSIKAKLRVDNKAIGDLVAQFYYVYLNLDSQVQAMVLPQLTQAEESRYWDYNTILDQLVRVYDNPNKVQEAEDRLLSLKQGQNEPIPAYIAKFERILYEARGREWPDVNKISLFRNGLNTTIRSRLSQQLNLPRTYPEFIRIVQQLARFSMAMNANSNSHPNGESMDLSSINSINAASPQQSLKARAQAIKNYQELVSLEQRSDDSDQSDDSGY